MYKLKELTVVFGVGAVIYGLTEVIFRGHTHWTMLLTGGAVFSCLYFIFDILYNENLLKNALLGAVIITTAEFAVGCVVNIGLNMHIWDYSHKTLNLYGQICPAFSFGWFGISIAAFYIAAVLRQNLRALT